MAIEQKYIDLINADIDGQISAEERAALGDFLSQNEEARRLHDEMAGLCGELDSLEALTPPADIRNSVLAGLPQQQRRSTDLQESSWHSAFVDIIRMTPIRYAMSFAAGVIVTFAVVSSDQISRQAFDDVTNLVGTMVEPGGGGGLTNADSMELSLNELAGSVTLNSTGPIMILDFDLASGDPVEIVARFDDRDIWFNGFAQLESDGTSVAAGSGQVTVRMEGQGRYAVYLNNAGADAATVNLRFYTSGRLLYEGDLVFDEDN